MPKKKHETALQTIGEVAEAIGVATHVLRFWEGKFPQIKPQKRRGRRYYSNEDIAIIQTIKELLYDNGYTIKGVHKFLKNKKATKSITENSNAIESAAVIPEQKTTFNLDLFGNIITENKTTSQAAMEFSIAEVSKLKQIYRGLCNARNKLHDMA